MVSLDTQVCTWQSVREKWSLIASNTPGKCPQTHRDIRIAYTTTDVRNNPPKCLLAN